MCIKALFFHESNNPPSPLSSESEREYSKCVVSCILNAFLLDLTTGGKKGIDALETHFSVILVTNEDDQCSTSVSGLPTSGFFK